MNKYQIAVNEAKKILTSRHRDKAHDLHHHELVWKNCEHLINKEQLDVEVNLLKIAAFWHDVVVDKVKWPSKINLEETCQHLTKLLRKLNFSDTEVKIVIESIKHHEFRDTPVNIEGMVLQDADKLEVVSFARWEHALSQYKKGLIKKESMVSYLKTFLKWSTILPSTFYFNESRNIAKSNLSELTTNPKWTQIFKKFGLENEYKDSLKMKSSIKTILLNLWLRCKSIIVKLIIQIRKTT